MGSQNQQRHDRKGVTIQKGTKVLLEGIVTEVFDDAQQANNDGPNCNVIVQIQGPRGSYTPVVACNALNCEVMTGNQEGTRQHEPATAGAGR